MFTPRENQLKQLGTLRNLKPCSNTFHTNFSAYTRQKMFFRKTKKRPWSAVEAIYDIRVWWAPTFRSLLTRVTPSISFTSIIVRVLFRLFPPTRSTRTENRWKFIYGNSIYSATRFAFFSRVPHSTFLLFSAFIVFAKHLTGERIPRRKLLALISRSGNSIKSRQAWLVWLRHLIAIFPLSIHCEHSAGEILVNFSLQPLVWFEQKIEFNSIPH